MVWKISLLILIFSSQAFAFDTYFFRVQLRAGQSVATLRTAFTNFGRQDKFQPFFTTNILVQPDTNYVLVQVTPQGSLQAQQVNIATATLVNLNLWKQVRITDVSIETVIDNSRTFPTDFDWSVIRSS